MKKPGLLLDLDPRQGKPSASVMFRLKPCPGSLALGNFVRRNGYFVPSSPAARIGTFLHKAWALEVLGDNPKTIEELHHKLSDEQWDVFSTGGGLREGLIAQFMAQNPNSALSDYSQYVERRLWYHLGDNPIFSGQPDLIVLDRLGKRALILDYKTGRSESQNAADNAQLRTEAVLLKAAISELVEIQAAIIEPLVSWDPVRVSYCGDAFLEAEIETLEIVDRATWNPKERHPGAWCAYCPGRVYCKEATRFIEQIPAFPTQNGDKLDTEGQALSQVDTEAMFRDLPRGERGSALWTRIKFAEKLLQATVQTYEQILAKEPDALPGFTLPEVGRSRTRVTDPAKLKEALADILLPEEIDACADYSLGQIAKHYAIKADIPRDAAKKLITDLTAEVTTITHDKPFIRPETKAEREVRG